MEGDLSFNRISMDSMLRIQRRGEERKHAEHNAILDRVRWSKAIKPTG